MKLHRLRLESFKRFRQPLEINHLEDGLNLFAAPNESGKSTIAEAIRVAFLERYRSSWAECLRPWDQTSASPSVALEFQIGPREYRLNKTFLGTKKRCDLLIDGKAMDGATAEDHLAELLGYQYAKKGASGADDMGVPGLLWIQQGTSHQLAERVVYAGEHLRSALGQSMGELAASQGDVILRQVKAARDALLHAGHGTPKGDYAAAIKSAAQCVDDVQRLTADLATYRHDVDQLSSLQAAYARDEASRPWEAADVKLAQARESLAHAQGLAELKATADKQHQQAQAQVKSAKALLYTFAKDEEAVTLRQAALRRAKADAGRLEAQLAVWTPRRDQAVKDEQASHQQLALVRQVVDRTAKAEAVDRCRKASAAIEEQLARAREVQTELTGLQAEVTGTPVTAPALRQLREMGQALRDAQSRLDAAATTLMFDLAPGATVSLNDAAVSGQAEHHLTRRSRLELPGFGFVDILPGGADLETLAAEGERQQQSFTAQLQVLGVASLAEAEDRAHRQVQLTGQIKARQELLNAFAPRGVSALESDLKVALSQLGSAEKEYAELPVLPGGAVDLPALATAQNAADESRAALAAASEAWHEARQALSAALADEATAQQELAAAQSRVQTAEWAGAQASASLALAEAQAHVDTARAQADELAHQLQMVDLPLLQMDVERLTRSVRQMRESHAERSRQITALLARLEVSGGLGLEEALAEQQQAELQAQRRADDLKRRARALDHLLQMLQARRAALAQRLRAPLQKHLNHYLKILFPGASVEVGDDLSPVALTRDGASGKESGAYGDLSVGAREQMGVLARLAYADLLREAGRPTLIILDDALVHSDNDRLEQMKRVLFDAATRHQLLIFTCHPKAWEDLGVVARPLQ